MKRVNQKFRDVQFSGVRNRLYNFGSTQARAINPGFRTGAIAVRSAFHGTPP